MIIPPSGRPVGGYRHPPDTDAALRLVRTIMPAVRRRLPGLRLLVVGADPGPELAGAATSDDTVSGTVSSVTPFVDQAALLALPIRIGGGMRDKLLEALAAGKMRDCLTAGAAGLEVTDGEELVLADTGEEFVEAIVALVGDPATRSRIGATARRWATRNLSWDRRIAEYEKLYQSLLASRAG